MASRKAKTTRSSKNTHSDSNASSKIAIIVAMIGVFGTLGAAYLSYLSTKTQIELPIVATQTAEAKSTEKAILGMITETSLSSISETPSIDITPTGSLSNAVIVVSKFYDWINEATTKDDFLRSWKLETEGINGMQCTDSHCDFSKFADYWWEWKVTYKLYNCGSNIVHAGVQYYPRYSVSAATLTAPYHIRFRLLEVDGELKLNDLTVVEGPGAECKLELSVP